MQIATENYFKLFHKKRSRFLEKKPNDADTSKLKFAAIERWVGGNRSKERDRKSELVLRSTYQIFEWDRNNSDRNFYNVVRYVHIPLVP